MASQSLPFGARPAPERHNRHRVGGRPPIGDDKADSVLAVENIFTDEEVSTITPGLHASFKLDKDGESLALVDTDANLNLLLDSTTFGPLGADKAWARPAASPTLFQIQAPSPGATNL